jgi:hypothetical protein
VGQISSADCDSRMSATGEHSHKVDSWSISKEEFEIGYIESHQADMSTWILCCPPQNAEMEE